MDPNHGPQSTFELPTPSSETEAAAAPDDMEMPPKMSVELASAQAEMPQSGFPPAVPPGFMPPADPVTSQDPTVQADNGTTVTPAIADDADLIEKEWVEKAKAIVEQTRTDPYRQNESITKFKADYIKKRYNREIKIDET